MNERRYGKWHYVLVTMALILAFFAFVLFLLFYFILGVAHVTGESMLPNYQNDQTVWFYRLTDDFNPGDVVAVKMPSGDLVIKRVVATEGDVVSVDDGHVYVNGVAFDDSYSIGMTYPQAGDVVYPYVVENDRYFVLGDNRENSVDSRSFRAIVRPAILGRVID